MSPISPTLTASSSATAYNPNSQTDFDPSFDKMQDFSEMFDFDQYEAGSSSSHTHSPKTISPNQTPSPLPLQNTSLFPMSPQYDFFNTRSDEVDFDSMDFGVVPKDQPAPMREDVVVKQEPVEFGFDIPVTASSTAAEPPLAEQNLDFGSLPLDQQQALQELLTNMIQYQSKFGAGIPPIASTPVSQPSPAPLPSTIQPSMVFGNFASGPSSTNASAGPSTSISPVASAPRPTPVPVASAPVSEEMDDEPLRSIEEQEEPTARSARQASTISSSYDDLQSKIDDLVPLPTIFSTGRGKGGKKGGGMSSVVRGDDEDVDDDDSWRPSPEEYKKLSSKEKRQLRNKLSARAFRNRRKDYIGTLEGHIKDRDTVIDAIKAELTHSRSENQDLRRELEALKASTMSILHPDSANAKGESPAMLSALSFTPSLAAAIPPAQVPPPLRRTPTPKFNARKDVPSSPAAFSRWGSNDFLSGGSTICHTMLTPDVVLPEASGSNKKSSPAPLRGLADLPRMNMNPMLNDDAPRMPSISGTGNARDLNNSFSDWSETNAFNFRSMDAYRIQMWSRLAREAQAEKTNTPADVRPKFFVEAQAVQAASSHISSKLASSFWSAFSGPTAGKLDTDKLTAVVTGKARLKVVETSYEQDEADMLAEALGGLKFQTGLTRTEGQGLRAREDPLGAISSLFRCHSACPQRA